MKSLKEYINESIDANGNVDYKDISDSQVQRFKREKYQNAREWAERQNNRVVAKTRRDYMSD